MTEAGNEHLRDRQPDIGTSLIKHERLKHERPGRLDAMVDGVQQIRSRPARVVGRRWRARL